MSRITMGALMVMLASGGCGDSGSGTPKKDAGSDARDGAIVDGNQVDAPADLITSETGSETATAACSTSAQDCGAGMKCDFSCPAQLKCVADTGTVPPGMACGGGTGACVKGAACLYILDGDGGMSTLTCRKFCTSSADCTSPETCAMTNLTCMPGDTPVLVGLCS